MLLPSLAHKVYSIWDTVLPVKLQKTRKGDGRVIDLAGMPFIKPEIFQTVVKELKQGAEIVVPTYNRKPGHPVGFFQIN